MSELVYTVPYCCQPCARAGYQNELMTPSEIFEHECREYRARYWLSEAFRPRYTLVAAGDGRLVDGEFVFEWRQYRPDLWSKA